MIFVRSLLAFIATYSPDLKLMHKASRYVTSLLCMAILLISVAQSAKAAGFTVKPAPAMIAAASSMSSERAAGAVHQVSTKATPTLTIATPTNDVTYGQYIVINIQVSGTSTPIGYVTLKRGTEIVTTTNLENSIATLNFLGTPLGAHEFKIEYAGNSEYEAATSNVLTVNVQKASPTVTLSSRATIYAVGEAVTLTASLPNTSTGTVTFKDGPTDIRTTTINNGSATFSPTDLALGTHSFTAHYSGDNNHNAATSNQHPITIVPALHLTPITLSNARIGASYYQAFTATGGTGPYTYSLQSGALPPGLSFTSTTGILTGTVDAAATVGSNLFTIRVTDAERRTFSRAFTLNVLPQTLAAPTLNLALSKTNPVAGETVTLTATLTGGNQPTGTVDIAFNGATQALNIVAGTGSVSLTPPSSGSYTISANYTGDASNMSATATTTLNVQDYLQLTTQTLPDATIGASYSQAFTASGGSGVYSYAVSSGALPAGFALEGSTGNLTGTAVPATTAGTYSFEIMVTDSEQRRATSTFVLKVVPQTLAAPTLNLALSKINFVAGEEVTLTATLTGGNQPTGTVDITFNGVSYVTTITNGTATVDITPNVTGSYTISASYGGDAQNSPAIASTTFTLVVLPALNLTAITLPDAVIGSSYSQTFTASGGSGVYSYAVSSGALPAGFALEGSTGNLTGTVDAATTAGTYSFAIMVTDSEQRRATSTFVLKVLAQAVSAPSRPISVPEGESPPNVNLETGATGGPFTSADIVSVTPSNAGTVSIVRGEFAQAGGSTPLGWYLKYVPRTGFSGTVTVRYTLTSATGTSSVAAITYTLKCCSSVVKSQIDSLARGFVASRQSMISSTLQVPGLLERRMAAEATEAVTTDLTPSEHGMTARFSTSLTQAKAARDAADGASGAYASPFNLWINGQMLAHRRDENGDAWGSFGMISLGADYLLSERTLVGLSAHYDVMREPTKEDAVLKGKGWLAGPYASLEIGKGAFWDTSLLYGGSSNEIDTEFWDGDFTTRRFMLDSAIKGQWQLEDNIVVTPKLRALYFNERASDYTVSNAIGDELTVYGFTAEQLRISLGVEIERSFLLTNGATFKPKLGLTGGLAGIEGSGVFGAASLGATLRTSDFWMLDAAILYNLEGHGQRSIGARIGASKQF